MPFRALIELVKESTNSFVFDLTKKSRSHAYKNKFRKYAIKNIHQLDDMNIYVRLSMSTNPITNNSITHEINTTIDENILGIAFASKYENNSTASTISSFDSQCKGYMF